MGVPQCPDIYGGPPVPRLWALGGLPPKMGDFLTNQTKGPRHLVFVLSSPSLSKYRAGQVPLTTNGMKGRREGRRDRGLNEGQCGRGGQIFRLPTRVERERALARFQGRCSMMRVVKRGHPMRQVPDRA